MSTVSFFIAGDPLPQPRVRCVCIKAKGTFPKLYTPKDAEDWEKLVVTEARRNRPPAPFDGPVRTSMTFCFLRPPEHFTRKGGVTALKPDAPHFHTIKPDRDNLEKLILDVLTKDAGFWKDDCQACIGTVSKIYIGLGETPGLFIKIGTAKTP